MRFAKLFLYLVRTNQYLYDDNLHSMYSDQRDTALLRTYSDMVNPTEKSQIITFLKDFRYSFFFEKSNLFVARKIMKILKNYNSVYLA